ncbi:hypothetical protein ACI8AA_13790 [Geodermatophilus sp. SYSU D01180]
MDLFAILRSIRRHWLVTALVVTLTSAAGAWLLLVMPRDYEAHASYVLVNPAPPPTDAQIERDPSLAAVNRNNPYLRFANEGTVGQVLSARMSGGTVRDALVAQGADADYTIGPSPTSAQIVDIVGTGTSSAEAEQTLALVSERMEAELVALQRVYGADDSALITPLAVADPTPGSVVLSGTIRSLVGVVGAGVILLFAAISIAEGRAALRPDEGRGGGRGRGRRQGRHQAVGEGETVPVDETAGHTTVEGVEPASAQVDGARAPEGAGPVGPGAVRDGDLPIRAAGRLPEPAGAHPRH